MSDTLSKEPNATDALRVAFTEGSVQLPGGYEDRTTNVLVPSNPQAQPNLSVARDWMRPGETLCTYIDRQLALLKSQLSGHRTFAREAAWLGVPAKDGEDETRLAGERIDASYKNGKTLIYQRQGAFEVAPSRVLVFTASTLHGFGSEFEQLWADWLASYLPPMSAQASEAQDRNNGA